MNNRKGTIKRYKRKVYRGRTAWVHYMIVASGVKLIPIFMDYTGWGAGEN